MRPYVTIHYAQTLDGRIATRTGESQWIGGGPSLHLAHELRAAHDVVMVGVGTVLSDNPRLTVRLVPGRSPMRVIADSTLRIPLDANVLVDGEAQTIVATTERAREDLVVAVRERGAHVLKVSQDSLGQVDLVDLFRRLSGMGVNSVLIEGGQRLITSVLRSRLVDRLVVCIAPKVLGAGLDAVGDLGIDNLAQALTFRQATVTRVGGDIIFDGYFTAPLRYPE